VELIKESGENLLTIINAILDHSKLEAGHFELENDDCSPREVTRYVVDLLQKSAKEKGLALNCKVADDVPSFFLCDNKRLRQILINLVGNAIKFTTIGAINLDVFLNSATDSPDTNIIFAVRDTGVGIPDAVLPRLFKRYKQADASTARTHGGTGLGLVISRDLATLMGGNIEVVSVQGIGTTFSLVLPMREATTSADSQKKEIMRQAAASETSAVPTKPKAETAPAPAKASKLRVLLAEDQPVNQKLMKAVMEQMGHDLTIANNGIEAVKAVRNFPFDLILMDIQMPELDGILATKIIRSADEDWRTIPIIAVTAHAMENHKQTYFAAGMNGFVSKPFRMDALVAEIERVLRNAHESPPTMEIAGGSLRQTDEDLKNSTNKEQALTDILNELDFLNT
jgi:CheY-like chemotaxis protein